MLLDLIIGQRTCTWQNAEYVLGLFGGQAGNARRLYGRIYQTGRGLGKKTGFNRGRSCPETNLIEKFF